MNDMLKLGCICSIHLHATVIFPFLYWQFSWTAWVKVTSSWPDRFFLFSPQSSVSTNYFQTVEMHICAVATVLGEKMKQAAQWLKSFLFGCAGLNEAPCPCKMRCHLLGYDRRTLQGLINNSWGFVSHDLWEHVSHIPEDVCVPPFVKLYRFFFLVVQCQKTIWGQWKRCN